MHAFYRWAALVLILPLLVLGCAKNSPAPQDKEAKYQAALAKLKPEDQKLAQAQKFCAVETANRLGSMGKPVKVMVKDQAVFVCCKHCEKLATNDPDKTLAVVQKLKDANTSRKAKE